MQLHQPNTQDQGEHGCAELKAMLSAYLDDELTREERLRADSHLIACVPCRNLVDRAEALDDTLRARFAQDELAAADELGEESADAAAMRARVLAQIGESRRRIWLPRLAAAAVVALCVGGGYLLWSQRGPSPLGPAGVGEFARGDRGGVGGGGVAVPSNSSIQLASLDPDERQALYSTSVLLRAACGTRFEDRARRDELVATVRYDELVDRLGEIMPKLSAEDRATVALARDVAARIAARGDDPSEWSRVREDVDHSMLDRSVDRLSEL